MSHETVMLAHKLGGQPWRVFVRLRFGTLGGVDYFNLKRKLNVDGRVTRNKGVCVVLVRGTVSRK